MAYLLMKVQICNTTDRGKEAAVASGRLGAGGGHGGHAHLLQ
jgi:hypothetical protein